MRKTPIISHQAYLSTVFRKDYTSLVKTVRKETRLEHACLQPLTRLEHACLQPLTRPEHTSLQLNPTRTRLHMLYTLKLPEHAYVYNSLHDLNTLTFTTTYTTWTRLRVQQLTRPEHAHVYNRLFDLNTLRTQPLLRREHAYVYNRLYILNTFTYTTANTS